MILWAHVGEVDAICVHFWVIPNDVSDTRALPPSACHRILATRSLPSDPGQQVLQKCTDVKFVASRGRHTPVGRPLVIKTPQLADTPAGRHQVIPQRRPEGVTSNVTPTFGLFPTQSGEVVASEVNNPSSTSLLPIVAKPPTFT